MSQQVLPVCMQVATSPIAALTLNSVKLFISFCLSCAWQLCKMAAIPQGAFLAVKIRQNEKRIPKEQTNCQEMNRPNPLQYNSKMMNSIWGLYNRYSVHNLKKNIDKNVNGTIGNQQIHSVGSVQGGALGTTSSPQVFSKTWDIKFQSPFGNAH